MTEPSQPSQETRELATHVIGFLFDTAERCPLPEKAGERKALRDAAYGIRKALAEAGITVTHERPPKETTHLVIGLYDDNGQRFADEVVAKTPKEAEKLFEADHPGVTIAGIVTGLCMKVVDSQD